MSSSTRREKAARAARTRGEWPTSTPITGMMLIGFVCATHWPVRTCLLLAYGHANRISRNAGLLCMAIAVGRVIGTPGLGLSNQAKGLPVCLATAGTLAALSWMATHRLGNV